MKRSPIPRCTSTLKRSRVRPFSAKRAAIRDERRAFVARILSERPYCEGPAHLRAVVHQLRGRDQEIVVAALRACGVRRPSTEVHEIVKRSRGGSIIDDNNVLALCHWCHAWTEEQPRLATVAGMLRSRYGS